MGKGVRLSGRSGTGSISKGTRSVQSKTRVSSSNLRSTSLKGAGVGLKHKNLSVKTGKAKPIPARKSPGSKLSPQKLYKQKKRIEKRAEGVAARHFRGKGYEVHRMQHNRSGHGVDLGVIKRDKSGQIRNAGVVETKGSGVRTPSVSAFKKQVRRSYYTPRLKKARDRGKAGAGDLYTLAKKKSPKLQSWAVTSGPQGNRLYTIPPSGKISSKYQSI